MAASIMCTCCLAHAGGSGTALLVATVPAAHSRPQPQLVDPHSLLPPPQIIPCLVQHRKQLSPGCRKEAVRVDITRVSNHY